MCVACTLTDKSTNVSACPGVFLVTIVLIKSMVSLQDEQKCDVICRVLLG